jgi:hypothetical protein
MPLPLISVLRNRTLAGTVLSTAYALEQFLDLTLAVLCIAHSCPDRLSV